MNVLIGFEESQTVLEAFLNKGHNAFSCDIQAPSGKFPMLHLQMDIFKALELKKWDFVGLHCPCTKTALCGNGSHAGTQGRIDAAEFTKRCWSYNFPMMYLEQPKTMMQQYNGKKSQVIHPYQFGHGEQKETWLWLKGLPPLQATNVVAGRKQKIFNMWPSSDRGKLRSKTYKGIAQAMANQWG